VFGDEEDASMNLFPIVERHLYENLLKLKLWSQKGEMNTNQIKRNIFLGMIIFFHGYFCIT